MAPDTIVIIVAMLGMGVALGTLFLIYDHIAEARLNKILDKPKIKQDASEMSLRGEINASEVRLREEIKAVEARTTAEIKASEARTSARFEEVREQFTEVNEQSRHNQARTDAGFADVNEQIRTTNDRMTSIERQQARLGGLLEGLRDCAV